ncbi:MAG: hypothetical protein KGL39_03715 [Patescibacteria group bacterium]|nr:hypothetical protein [Patescibacteria group bacterium]
MSSGDDYRKHIADLYHAKVLGGPELIRTKQTFIAAVKSDAALRAEVQAQRARMTDDVCKRDFTSRVMRPVLDEALEA